MLDARPNPRRESRNTCVRSNTDLGSGQLAALPDFFRSMYGRQELDSELARRLQNLAQIHERANNPASQQYSIPQLLLSLSRHASGRDFLAEHIILFRGLDPNLLGNLRVKISSEHHHDFYPLALLGCGLDANLLEHAAKLTPRGIALWLSCALRASSSDQKMVEIADALRSQINSNPLTVVVFNVLGVPGPLALSGIEKLAQGNRVNRVLRRVRLKTLSELGQREESRFGASAQQIAASGAELILLQEMWHPKTRLIREALQALGMQCFSGVKSHGLIKRSGLHTYSRCPIDFSKEHVFSRSVFRELIHSTEELFVDKGYLLTQHNSSSLGPLSVINTHLLARPPAFRKLALPEEGRFSLRHRQIMEIFAQCDKLMEQGRNFIAAGDWNVDENCEQYGVLRNKLGTDIYRLRYPLNPNVRISDSVVTPEIRAGLTLDHGNNPTRPDLLRPHQRPDMAFMCGFDLGNLALRIQVCFKERPVSDHYAVRFDLLPIG